jgi:hypothetical protein
MLFGFAPGSLFSDARSLANLEVFCEVTLFSLVNGCRRFEGAYRLHCQGSGDPRKIRLGVLGPLYTKKNTPWVI